MRSVDIHKELQYVNYYRNVARHQLSKYNWRTYYDEDDLVQEVFLNRLETGVDYLAWYIMGNAIKKTLPNYRRVVDVVEYLPEHDSCVEYDMEFWVDAASKIKEVNGNEYIKYFMQGFSMKDISTIKKCSVSKVTKEINKLLPKGLCSQRAAKNPRNKGKTSLTAEQQDAAIMFRAAQQSYSDIAKRIGSTKSSVMRFLKSQKRGSQ